MAAEGLSWLARNGRSRGPRACGVASPGEESLAAAIAARRSRLAVLWPDHAIKRPRGSRARQPFKEKTWQAWVRARARASRAKEQKPWRTEGRSQSSGTRAALASRHRGLSAAGFGAVARSAVGTALPRSDFTIDSRRTPNRRYDEARPQLSLAAGAAGNSGLPPATSLDPISGGFGSARRAHAVVPAATAPISANARCHSSAGTPSWARPRDA